MNQVESPSYAQILSSFTVDRSPESFAVDNNDFSEKEFDYLQALTATFTLPDADGVDKREFLFPTYEVMAVQFGDQSFLNIGDLNRRLQEKERVNNEIAEVIESAISKLQRAFGDRNKEHDRIGRFIRQIYDDDVFRGKIGQGDLYKLLRRKVDIDDFQTTNGVSGQEGIQETGELSDVKKIVVVEMQADRPAVIGNNGNSSNGFIT